jgi:hypothetical protein
MAMAFSCCHMVKYPIGYNKMKRKYKTMGKKIQTLASFLDCDIAEIRDGYIENVYEYGNAEYMVLTDEEADKKTKEYILDSLWAFNTRFILDHSRIENVTERTTKAFREMQEKLCEDANEIVSAIIEDIDEFVDDAIEADGRGHFLSGYDGEENEVQDDEDFTKYYYIYRTN